MGNNKNERKGEFMKILKYLAYALVLIGALNWGLVGIFDFDLVAAIFGDMTIMTRILYSLVGISAVITAFSTHECVRIETKKDEYGNCRL